MLMYLIAFLFFFFNDTATTEIYTLSLHDALPISDLLEGKITQTRFRPDAKYAWSAGEAMSRFLEELDRKSTRLNSSHDQISYAVFCLKKKKTTTYAGIVMFTGPCVQASAILLTHA